MSHDSPHSWSDYLSLSLLSISSSVKVALQCLALKIAFCLTIHLPGKYFHISYSKYVPICRSTTGPHDSFTPSADAFVTHEHEDS